MRHLTRIGWLVVLLSVSSFLFAFPATAEDRIYYYHNDHQGRPVAMTDENAQVVWKADYEPSGEAHVTVSTIENNYRGCGQHYDPETGLTQNWHRDYAATLGRYIEPDPIGMDGEDVNLYAYVWNNPVNWSDPEGLSPVGWVIKLLDKGGRKILRPLLSEKAARTARKQGEDVLVAGGKGAAKAIEKGQAGGKEIVKHKGHLLDPETDVRGQPHFQTPGQKGHTFWGGLLGVAGSLLDPFDPISGELARDEDYLMDDVAQNPCVE